MAKKETTGEKSPRVTVLERRLQNPFGEPSAPVEYKDPRRVGRWFNSSIVADKIWRAKHNGWTPTRPEDVVDLDQIGGYVVSPDNVITRGERGQEVLMWMYAEDRDQIEWAKAKRNMADMRDFDKEKQKLVEAAAAKYGGQAADYLNARVGPVGTVTSGYERIERRPDGE